MAAAPWKPLYWERFHEAVALTGASRGDLAVVIADLSSSPPRAGDMDEALALALIEACGAKLGQAATLVALAVSVLGTLELLAVRWVGTQDDAEERTQARGRAARQHAIGAYDTVAKARGHLGAAGRLYADSVLLHHAADEERVVVVEALKAASRVLERVEGLLTLGTPLLGRLPPAEAVTRWAAAAAAAPPTSLVAAWSSVGCSVPGRLLHVALSGALPDIEEAQAALQRGADAVDKLSKTAAFADMLEFYRAAFRALDAAHSALSALLAVNAKADVLFGLCAPKLELVPGGNDWLSWEAARADAERHARAALDRLWSASTHLDYAFTGVLAWSAPESGGQEARDLMDRAIADAGEAREAGDKLRHAAGRKFLHAWNILHRATSVSTP